MSGELGGSGDIASGGEIAVGGGETAPSVEISVEASPIGSSEAGLNTVPAEPIVDAGSIAAELPGGSVEAPGTGTTRQSETSELSDPNALTTKSNETGGGPVEPPEAGASKQGETSELPDPNALTTKPNETAEGPVEPPDAGASRQGETSDPNALTTKSNETADGSVKPPEAGATRQGETSDPNALTTKPKETADGPVEPPDSGASRQGETSDPNALTTKSNETADGSVKPPEAGATRQGETSDPNAPTAKSNETADGPAEPPEAGASRQGETSDRNALTAKSNETADGPAEPPEAGATKQGKETPGDSGWKEGDVPLGKEQFAAFKAAAEKSAIESINKDQVLEAVDGLDQGLPITSEPRTIYARHGEGFLGEEGTAINAQRTEGMVVEAKTSVSETNKPGFDLVELRAGAEGEGPKLVEGDNKVQNTRETVYAVPSLIKNHTQNEAAVVDRARERVGGPLAADRLVAGATLEAIGAGRTSKEVTNYGATGTGAQRVSERLDQAGVTLRDVAGEIKDAARNSTVVPERVKPTEDI
jgi:hypothetical protein